MAEILEGNRQMEDMRFQVLWRDKITAEVEIKENKAHIKKYDNNPIRCLFPYEETDSYHVAEILEGRCWPRNRDNIDDLLKACGLKSYDVMGIIKVTHGRMYNDQVWIRFEGEELSYNDFSLRKGW